MFQEMKLTKKLSKKHSTLFLILIFAISLASIFYLYYILNIQYPVGKPLSNGPVTTLPKTLTLDLNSPDDESLTFQSSILVSGQTAPLKEVLIFTDSQNMVIKSKLDGSFSQSLDLDAGINKITVVVFDDKGDPKSQERTVYYSQEKL